MGKETGLICTGESVRAILASRKTQTRRVMKPQPTWEEKKVNSLQAAGWKWDAKKNKLSAWPHIDEFSRELVQYCPYGQVGDRLWCKEAFNDCDGIHYCKPRYKATDENYPTAKWKSSRFMFKKYARIWLEITGIRVERVQEIDAVEAEAEGMRRPKKLCPDRHDEYILLRFERLWDSLNAKRGYPWSDEDLPDNLKTGKGRIMYGNPWVWVLEFKRISDGN